MLKDSIMRMFDKCEQDYKKAHSPVSHYSNYAYKSNIKTKKNKTSSIYRILGYK